MNLTEMAGGTTSTVVIHKDDPDAVRVKFVGFPPGKHDSRHPEFEPSGDLMPGEMGYGKPARPGQVNGMWNFTSDRGFSMFLPPHDLKRDPSDEKYPNLGTTDQKLMKSHHLADLMKDKR
jgi:hypothetical protein